MKYMLLIYGDEAGMAKMTKTDFDQMLGAYNAYTKAMQQAGVLIAGDPLQPTSTATSVRVANGKTQVLNGPYAETKEQFAGYYIVDVPDLDAALSWASRCPGASVGTIEVRPLRAM